jgi:hypothetical protein
MSFDDSFDSFSRLAQNNGPDRCVPRFHVKAVRLAAKSKEEGRDVYEDREFVEIITPGDTKSIIDRAVTDEDRRRWPQFYAAFKAGREEATVGTPLELWPPIGSPAMVQTLKALHIRTVEDLAGLSDSGINNIGMGGRVLRDKAQLWLSEAKDKGAAILTALEERDADKARIQQLEEQVAELGATIAAMQKNKTRRAAEADA